MTTLEIFGIIGIIVLSIIFILIILNVVYYFSELNENIDKLKHKLEKLEHKLEKLERQGEDTSVHKLESRAKDYALLKRIQKLEQEVYSNENSI